MWYLFQGQNEHGRVRLSTYLESQGTGDHVEEANEIEEFLEEEPEEAEEGTTQKKKKPLIDPEETLCSTNLNSKLSYFS